MQISLADVKIYYTATEDLAQMSSNPVLPVFDGSVVEFLHRLSAMLLKKKDAKQYPDIMTFAFFCRKTNIEKIKESRSFKQNLRMGRGLSFHIAPSNIPINFAYTMVAGLLAGNSCVVKVSSKDFPQTTIIANAIKEIMAEDTFQKLRTYLAIISYDRDSEMTSALSRICDFRVIWGGDATIDTVRKSQINGRAFDITFADRYSFAVIGASGVLDDASPDNTARAFYNDTYLYDQNACSAPRLIFWLGEEADISAAQEKFWGAVYHYTKERYSVEAVMAVDKYLALCRSAIEMEQVKSVPMEDNLISRISLASLVPNLPDFRCPGGSFLEYAGQCLDPLSPIVTSGYQTLSYFGVEPAVLEQWVREAGLHGIDRIVPVGKATDFSFLWDGYDMIDAMSRILYVE